MLSDALLHAGRRTVCNAVDAHHPPRPMRDSFLTLVDAMADRAGASDGIDEYSNNRNTM
jgi:hypothetical protein